MTPYTIRHIAVVIPSLNPDDHLPRLVTELTALGFANIFIVNDGSKEACLSVFETLRCNPACTVLEHPVNQGKGRALKTAFTHYLQVREKLNLQGIVTADADGQHLPEDILRVAEALLENPDHLVMGTRDFDVENVPPKSRGGNKITTAVFRILYGKLIRDTQTGLRGIPNHWVEPCLHLPGERFEYEINMLVDAVRQKVPLKEVLIQTVYYNSNRETHFRPVIDSLKIYSVFLKYLLASLITSATDYVVFAIIFAISNHLMLATIFARVVATFVSFFTQKTFVFDYQHKILPVFFRFVLLVICSGIASYWIIKCISSYFTASVYLLKLLAETAIYFVNYLIQRKFVWHK